MNLKKFISLLFVLLSATSVVFAANNTRNAYSVYSDNFNGTHYGAPSSDADSVEFQLWSNQSMSGETKTDTPIEGKSYSRLTNGTPHPEIQIWKYGGGGFASTNSSGHHDMSGYYGGELKFCARSNNSNMANLRVGIKIIGTEEIMVPLSSLGFSANGQWQELSIPLTSSTDVRITESNLGTTNYLLIFNLPEGNYVEGESIDLDNVRWVKSSGAEFSVVRKKVSDNSVVSDQTAPISFSEDTLGQGWVVADQYIEMDVDGDFSNNNWTIRAYTSNEIEGLYNIHDSSDVLPTAWKVSCSTLPYVYTDYNDQGTPFQNKNTLQIGENKSESGEFFGLYDAGKVEFLHDEGVKWLYPWFFVKANGDTSDASVIWQNISGNPSQSGCHTFENTSAGGATTQFYDALTDFYERKPKLFFACDTRKAKATKYTASFVINLSYE